jgi:Family of unknown function (DUF6055)
MRTRAASALAAVIAALACAPASGASPAAGRSHATIALERARDALDGVGVRSGRDVSVALARLYAALPQLNGSDRAQAEALLARPDDSQADPDGTHKWTVPEAMASPYCTAHFCVHWVTTSADAPPDAKPIGVPASVQQMAAIFENEVHPCENGTAPDACALVTGAGGQMGGTAPGLGWREPADDSPLGGDNRLDIYIEDLYPTGAFGYEANDPGQSPDPAVPHHAYMVMDKDYSRFANGDAALGLADERVTAAHEYNHVLQNAYDYLQDEWMFEATAVWMEEKVYPTINDYLRYIPDWANNPGQPLTTFTDQNLKPYGDAVWNHWLDHRYGAQVVRAAWEDSVAAASFAPAAYDLAIAGAGGAGFNDEFARFTAATAEWDAPGAGFPDIYVDVARNGSLPAGNVTAPFALPHTSFALFDVPIPADAPPVIRLTATLPAGTAGALALVARTGTTATAGTVTSSLTQVPSGGLGAVKLDDPASFGRITAVVANADATTNGFDPRTSDYVFTHDAPDVTARIDPPSAPVAVTGDAVRAAEHSATVLATIDPRLLLTSWWIEYGPTTRYGSRSARSLVPSSELLPQAGGVDLDGLAASTTYHYRVVATNTGGAATGVDRTFRTARDLTRPRLTLQVGTRRGAVVLRITASERCRGSAEIELSSRRVRRLRLPRILGRARVALPVAGQARRFVIRLRRASRHAQPRRLAARLRVDVRDPAGNPATAARRLVVGR